MDPVIAELVRQVADLQRRVAALECKEYAIMQSGNIGAPVHAAAESVFYWDTLGDCLYINYDGDTGWCLIYCCQPS
jgi:hypothetical protein